MSAHPTEAELLQWLDRDLEPDQQREVLRHVQKCERCAEYLRHERRLGDLLAELPTDDDA